MDLDELNDLDDVFKKWQEEENTCRKLSKRNINLTQNQNKNQNFNQKDEMLKLIFVMFYMFTMKYYFDKYNMKDKSQDEFNQFIICHHYKIFFFAAMILHFVDISKINNFLKN